MQIQAVKHKLLLFNASNMITHPVYPYAFIQVPAIARRVGIDVICRDLLDIPRRKWAQAVQSLIEQHRPSMILITLRNTDSLSSRDYKLDGSNDEARQAYFPIERTKELIAAIREVSDLQIVIGGFGFSLLSTELMHYLRPDFGVFGAPDGFLQHYADVLNETHSGVSNLLYFESGQLIANPRVFYPPLPESEYTTDVIEVMMAFYDSFPTPGFRGAPVEIMRGCCHSCVFCSEPHVAGSEVKYRDQSAVMKDIETLADHGITHIYMISSELNPEGNDYILQLADRIQAFNQSRPPERHITWFGANYLLAFGPGEHERLQRSGFTGGWFDITALDDENARAMRTPYRNVGLLPNLKTYAQFTRRPVETQVAEELLEAVIAGSQDRGRVRWTMFLGNPATTVDTIRKTLRVANHEELPQQFGDCYIIPNIRVFDYEDPTDVVQAGTYSITEDLKRIGYNQRLPSFAYSPALLEHFGSEEAISAMFLHIAETYLSTKYRETRNWSEFIRQRTTAEKLSNWVAALSDAGYSRITSQPVPVGDTAAFSRIEVLFADALPEEQGHGFLAEQTVDMLLPACLALFPDCFAPMGLIDLAQQYDNLTPYRLSVMIFKQWSTEQGFREALMETVLSYVDDSMLELLNFGVEALLYKFNVQILPTYRALFVSDYV